MSGETVSPALASPQLAPVPGPASSRTLVASFMRLLICEMSQLTYMSTL